MMQATPTSRDDIARLKQEGLRILKPVAGDDHWPSAAPPNAAVRTIGIVDVETTGLDPALDAVIELSVAICHVDEAGQIVAIPAKHGTLIDPGFSLSPVITKLTGINDAMVRGQGISKPRATEALAQCDWLISYNCRFDRQFIERLLPDLPLRPWACAMRDVDWRDLGFEPGPQGYLLAQAGLYNPAVHRAMADVQSLTNLLSHRHSDGETMMAKLLANAAKPAWRFEAANAPFHHRGELFRRGYTFSWRHKLRHRLVREIEFDIELDWYREAIGRDPIIVSLPPTERWRADWNWQPTKA